MSDSGDGSADNFNPNDSLTNLDEVLEDLLVPTNNADDADAENNADVQRAQPVCQGAVKYRVCSR